MDSINLSELEIKLISSEDNMGVFDCKDADLNEFLRDDALDQMNVNMNVTYLCRYKGQLIAYFTLSADSVKVNPADREKIREKGVEYGEFPAVKIGRLAVSNHYRKMGVGTDLLLRIIGKSLKLSEHIGIRFISVDAYTGSIKFYRDRFFTEFIHDGKRRTVSMYLDLLKLEKLPD